MVFSFAVINLTAVVSGTVRPERTARRYSYIHYPAFMGTCETTKIRISVHKTIMEVNPETRRLLVFTFQLLNDKVIKQAITVVCMSYILINIYINSRHGAYNLKLVYF